MERQEGTQQPQLILGHRLFLLTHPDVGDTEKARLREEVLAAIKSEGMVNLYETLVGESLLERDQSVLDAMLVKNEEELQTLEGKIAEAEENLGESEIREAHWAKSLFYIRIIDREKALEQLKVTESKTVDFGQKMDLVFYNLLIGFFFMDFGLISKSIDKAKNLFEEGDDRERKNRLKVYEGLYCMHTLNLKKAASLFLDSMSTFTAYDLIPYDTFIFYTVLTGIMSLDGVSLKQKVLNGPGISTAIGKIPFLSKLLNSLDGRCYQSVFEAYAGLTDQIKLDRYLHPSINYYRSKEAALNITKQWDPDTYFLEFDRLTGKAESAFRQLLGRYRNPFPTFAHLPAVLHDWAQENVRPSSERPNRPISLILEGPTRTGKTCWARSLGRHNYYAGYMWMADHDDEALYNVIDDINPGSLKNWKELIGAQRDWYAKCQFVKRRKIAGGIPSIILCNPGRGWSYQEHLQKPTMAELKEWTEQHAIFFSIHSSLF